MAERLIAIIDDDESLRSALLALVRSLGYRGIGFASAEEFLASAESRGSACIVTDIQMSGISGIELTQRLIAQGTAAPVILITARTEPALLDRAQHCGALCVLRKPFAAEALIGCLETALAA